MAPRIGSSPFTCPSCTRRLSKTSRSASTTSTSSQSRSKVLEVDQFLTSPSSSSAATRPISSKQTSKNNNSSNQYAIPPSALSYHWDTSPASPSTLQAAKRLFTSSKPVHLWTRSTFRDTPVSTLPEVAFLGRSNVGKSSLLNAMLGAKELARTSSRPGRTKTMNAFLVGGDGVKNSGRGKLVVLDMPGYGKGARAEWGVEVIKYLRARKQLKRAILLLSAHHLTDDLSSPPKSSTTTSGSSPRPIIRIKPTDQLLLSLLRTHRIPHQVILSKIDRVLFPSSQHPSPASFSHNIHKAETIMQGLQHIVQPSSARGENKKHSKKDLKTGLLLGREGPPALGEIWACAADGRAGIVGVDGVRVAVMRACGLETGRRAARSWPLGLDEGDGGGGGEGALGDVDGDNDPLADVNIDAGGDADTEAVPASLLPLRPMKEA